MVEVGVVGLKIKEFSQRMRISADSVRYYEKLGLIHPKRLNNGYRQYDGECEKDIQLIIVLKQLGFSLNEIQGLLKIGAQPISSECNEQSVQLFERKLEGIKQRIQFWQKTYGTLEEIKGLMSDGKYKDNASYIDQMVQDMYLQIEGGADVES